MSRVQLVRGAEIDPQNCAHCGKRMIGGIVYAVEIKGERFRVCSFECEDALKEKHQDVGFSAKQ